MVSVIKVSESRGKNKEWFIDGYVAKIYLSLIRSQPQILLFSATFPENVRKFSYKFAPDANEITLKREELSVDAIKQFYMDCNGEDHKYEVLCNLYELLTVSQSIIFCKVKY
jgi:ATP-dependent RNA helicase DDX19/DBP5